MSKRHGKRTRTLGNTIPYIGRNWIIGDSEGDSYKHAIGERIQHEVKAIQGNTPPEQVSAVIKSKFKSVCSYCGLTIGVDDEICKAKFKDAKNRWVHLSCCIKDVKFISQVKSKSNDTLPIHIKKDDPKSVDSNKDRMQKIEDMLDALNDLQRKIVKHRSEPEDVISLLKNYGLHGIDKRPMGGALWVIGGRELSETMKELQAKGFRFFFSEKGGRVSKHQPAWFCKDKAN